MLGKSKKLFFFWENRPQKSGLKAVKKCIFEGDFAFQIVLKNFLRIQWLCSRYLEGAPGSYLHAHTKIGTVRHTNQKICTEKQKNSVFWKIDLKKGVEISPKNTVFQGVFAFQITLKNFLRIQWPCSRYLEGAPGSYLYAQTKIRTVRRTNQKIFQKNRSSKEKNRVFPHFPGVRDANTPRNTSLWVIFDSEVLRSNPRKIGPGRVSRRSKPSSSWKSYPFLCTVHGVL